VGKDHGRDDAIRREDEAAGYDRRARIVAWRRQEGLPVDDAVIARVLEHAADGLAHPGMWETREEAARRERGQALIDACVEAVDAYAEAHADTHAGTWYEWNDNEPTLVVAFAGELEPHVAALSYPGVRVVGRPRPRRELDCIVEEVFAAQPPAGAQWVTAGVFDEQFGGIEVWAMGPDESAVAAWLADRHGTLVRLKWLGSVEPQVKPVSWQTWEPSGEDPCMLTVRWSTNSAYELERVAAEERPDSVMITVFEAQPPGFVTLVRAYRSATVRLEAPIAERRIIDAVTGVVRPRL
jgi:hypothetical protein